MPARDKVDGERDQAQRSGERGRSESFKREDRVTSRFDDGSRGSRFGCVNQHRDNGLKQTQGFVRAGRAGRSLRIRIRGERGQASEDETSESHFYQYVSTYNKIHRC